MSVVLETFTPKIYIPMSVVLQSYQTKQGLPIVVVLHFSTNPLHTDIPMPVVLETFAKPSRGYQASSIFY
jgi:hypothetical protein